MLINASSGLVLALLSLGVSCHSLGLSDHVLAQARLTGLLRCMSDLVGAMLRRLDRVLAQACYRLVAVQRRRGNGLDSQIPLRWSRSC